MSDPVRDLKQELLAAAERQREHAVPRSGRDRLGAHWVRNRVLVAAALLPVAVAVSLFFTAPWKSSPGFLDRAQAALAPPPGSVLHKRWNEALISKELGCTVELPTQELWVDQVPPHRYRLLTWNLTTIPESPRKRACGIKGEIGIAEFGGALDAHERPLLFLPPDTLTLAHGWLHPPNFPPDPVPELREAIRDGRAHDEGKTELDGRVVERIRIDPRCPDPPCDRPPGYVYVDPETFSFVREEWPSGVIFRPGPDPQTFRFDVVRKYLTFDYLPRTEDNLALTDIRAQHPNARGGR